MKRWIMRTGLGLVVLFAVAVASAAAQQLKTQAPARPGTPSGLPTRPATSGTPRVAAAQPKAAPTPTPTDPAEMNAVLVQWAKRTRGTQSLSAKFTRVDIDPVWKKETHYQGTAHVKLPNQVYLNFEQISDDDGKKLEKPIPHERIVCSGTELFQFLPETKQLHHFPLPPEERQKMREEGPLPFLFNLDAEKAKRRYRMELAGKTDTQYLVQIIPAAPEDQQVFSRAYIWLDRTRALQPARIRLIDPSNPKLSKEYLFSEISQDSAVNDLYFDGREQWKRTIKSQPGWNVVEHGPDGKPSTPPAAVAPPAAKAAQRPTAGPRR